MTTQNSARMNGKSGRVSGRLGHFSKTDVRFWQGHLFRETYRNNGRLCQTTHWSARIQHKGRRERFPLYTPNKAAAAARARDIYLFLVANGWDAALTRYRKPKGIVREQKGGSPVTVGEFLDEVFRTASNQRTIESYAKRFRHIVAEIFDLSKDKEKHDYWQGGAREWLAKVHGAKLAEVTPTKVEEWKRSFLAKAENDPVSLRRARISVNSTLRQARSLFSETRLRHLQVPLPSPLPFEGVQFEPRQSMKYRSEINLVKLINMATSELRDSSPEEYKAFLLAVGAGLRKKEIDLLEWSSFRWEENVIRIEPTRYFHPKSEDSIADIPVDREVMNLFRGHYERVKGIFVIKSRQAPAPARPRQYYRCKAVFDRLVEWLRKHGVNGSRPLHTLRKEYGSLLTRTYGIHAASRALRHADLRTTSEHYSDSTARVTPGIGALLKDGGKSGDLNDF